MKEVSGKEMVSLNSVVLKRTFYVDSACSIFGKDDKRYWKCSVVENGKNILNFANGKLKSTEVNSAEAFTILKVIFWLAEQKWSGEVQIFTDNQNCVHWYDKIVTQSLQCNKSNTSHDINCLKYLTLTRDACKKNSIELKINWIEGKNNPADFYSREQPKKCSECKKYIWNNSTGYNVICPDCQDAKITEIIQLVKDEIQIDKEPINRRLGHKIFTLKNEKEYLQQDLNKRKKRFSTLLNKEIRRKYFECCFIYKYLEKSMVMISDYQQKNNVALTFLNQMETHSPQTNPPASAFCQECRHYLEDKYDLILYYCRTDNRSKEWVTKKDYIQTKKANKKNHSKKVVTEEYQKLQKDECK